MKLSRNSINELSDLAQRHATLLALGGSIVLALLVVVLITFHTLDLRKAKAQDYAPQNAPPLLERAAQQGIRSDVVTRANLFGNKAPALVAAPKTTLNLTLQGVLSANVPGYARAIIQAGSQASQLYSVGDEIKGSGAKLEEIRMNEVLLNRAGAIESLPLNKAGNMQGANISFSKATDSVESAFLSQPSPLTSLEPSNTQPTRSERATMRADRERARADSPNGPRREIKRPAFSGIDRAIKKADEI